MVAKQVVTLSVFHLSQLIPSLSNIGLPCSPEIAEHPDHELRRHIQEKIEMNFIAPHRLPDLDDNTRDSGTIWQGRRPCPDKRLAWLSSIARGRDCDGICLFVDVVRKAMVGKAGIHANRGASRMNRCTFVVRPTRRVRGVTAQGHTQRVGGMERPTDREKSSSETRFAHVVLPR